PIVAFDFGAIAERLRAHQRGRLLPVEWMLEPGLLLEVLREESARRETEAQRFLGYRYRSLLSDYYDWPDHTRAVRGIIPAMTTAPPRRHSSQTLAPQDGP